MRVIESVLPEVGDAIAVQLDNDHTVLFNLHILESDPAYAELIKTNAWLKPKTDGTHVYWDDGPRISVEELLALLEEPLAQGE